ncbi:uncharacterized protein LOC122250052 [Penaeus japonicus]|uniref:uncharacterized protein LOC122250052 n=1 Tax=Penaeus japonicus TaxID=27405 RepID=UPI001C70B559|nr:uncharacterized protein LOC122250052 [Penaeus japonicus]
MDSRCCAVLMGYKRLRCVAFALLAVASLLLLMTVALHEDDLALRTDGTIAARLQGPLEFDDPQLLSLVRRDHLQPPSTLEYDLMRGRTDSEASVYNMYIVADAAFPALAKVIAKMFEGVRGGFFVEAGAMDGEFLSNTLALERDLGWTGLLVEADGDMYHHLLGKHRRAWTSHACLALQPFPHREVLIKYSGNRIDLPGSSLYARAHGALSAAESASPLKVTGGDLGRSVPQYEGVQCLPLASLLLALDVTHVHFISLDVEGAEPAILRSFAWDAITVDVWLVEHITNPSRNAGDRDAPKATPDPDPKRRSSSPVRPVGSPDSAAESSAAFASIFLSRGYALYPMPGGALEGNFFFVREKSDVYERLRMRGDIS